jgi:cell division protease FtsH
MRNNNINENQNKDKDKEKRNVKKIALIAFAIVAIGLYLFFRYYDMPSNLDPLPYKEFVTMVEEGEVAEVDYTFSLPKLKAKLKNGKEYEVDNPQTDDFKKFLLENDVKINPVQPQDRSYFYSVVIQLVNVGVSAMVILYVAKKVVLSQIRATDKNLNFMETSDITFDDVAGNEEAKESMMELVEFINNPVKYKRYGAKVPRGTILYGPPGTGKTLMAKALAGTAGVPFVTISGSDFVEKFVGVGASRVRQLFQEARKRGPCIIFVDEIDAVGKTRSTHGDGGHEERDQTLNQLLVEMDGFNDNDQILVIAATNRLDTLDPALLRSGRFDRQIKIELPDLEARYEILKLHAKNKPMHPEVDLMDVAKMTTFMSGADLANVMNEASIYAAKNNHKGIMMEDLDRAVNKILAGEEKKNRKNIHKKDREVTAFHEAGHAIVAKLMANKSIPKVTIIPTTKGAGGYTMIASEEKMYLSKKELLNEIAISLGGRAAEEIVYGNEEVTSGASHDIKQATGIALQMIKDYGMNEKVGLVNVNELYGHSYAGSTDEQVANEVKREIETIYRQVLDFLKERKDLLYNVKEILMEKETIYEKELDKIFNLVE